LKVDHAQRVGGALAGEQVGRITGERFNIFTLGLQRTGDDGKVLMGVCLPAVKVGQVVRISGARVVMVVSCLKPGAGSSVRFQANNAGDLERETITGFNEVF